MFITRQNWRQSACYSRSRMINCIRKSIKAELFSTNQEESSHKSIEKVKIPIVNCRMPPQITTPQTAAQLQTLPGKWMRFNLAPSPANSGETFVRFMILWFTLFGHLTKNIFVWLLNCPEASINQAQLSGMVKNVLSGEKQKALTFMLNMTSTTQPFIKYQR